MSFSWECRDKEGADLFAEFNINKQAIGLSDDNSPVQSSELRAGFSNLARWGDKHEAPARDAMESVQDMVRRNISYYTAPEHPECPCCTCKRVEERVFFRFDMKQALRFVSIPIDRVWRCSGGY